MAIPDLSSKQYPLDVVTENYLMHCTVEPVGMLMTYLDSPDRTNLRFKDVTLNGLSAESTVNCVKMKELFVQRNEILAICLDETYLQGAVQKFHTQEKLRVFLPRVVIQGVLTHGEDTRVGDMFEVMKGTWAAVNQAQVFPLTNLKVQLFREAPFMLVNKNHICFYEVISAN